MDPSSTKYLIKARFRADGSVEKPDVIGALFGQTEGLIGDELDLRELQKSARVGRIEVELESNKGKSNGEILLTSSMEKVETSILAAAIESVDRIGPCKAEIEIEGVEDVRVARRKRVIDRAKQILGKIIKESREKGEGITESVRQAVQIEEITSHGPDKLPAGPNVGESDAIIIVEGRSDILNLLKYGIKNAIAVEGTNISQTIIDLCEERIATAFVDGDRGGKLILKELLQAADIDFVARAPQTREVEEIPEKLITKSLKNKIPAEQYRAMYKIKGKERKKEKEEKGKEKEEKGKREEREETKEKAKINEKQENYKKILDGLSGSSKAVLLDKKGEKMEEIEVGEMIKFLKFSSDEFSTIVFDGIATQRLIDVADDRGIKTIVSRKMHDIEKMPTSIDILTKDELG